ncbi:PepSY-associated TM helix domain-containing protein [Zunongwangia sp.]|uniref:PepSY-associated TM helix domain-containing protein n=1 Tax=Zunongwangia sp. TaxID=1965325 RepID=UPI003AA8F6C8
MPKRNYNVFFHLHTISGIIISVALFIMFFCGAFALFKDEITAWEKGIPVNMEKALDIDYDRVIKTIKEEGYTLKGRDIRFTMPDAKQKMLVVLNPSKIETAPEAEKKSVYFNINTRNYKISTYYKFYSIGELIYRLHFFSQIPRIGYYLSGLIAFFFLLAIVTGVIIHWKKIIPNFYTFRPKSKFKTIWTDAHTALGVIGLPFQFMYALTSCILCLTALILVPLNFLYNGQQQKVYEEVRPAFKNYEWVAETNASIPSLNTYVVKAEKKWAGFTPTQIFIKNYKGQNMKFQVDGLLDAQHGLFSNGRMIFDGITGAVIAEKNPKENTYTEAVEIAIRRLHFGDFGGLFLKTIYFILALITCFVILSGVLIWLVARDKKHIDARKRKFNRGLGYFYIALCMSLYPVIAANMLVAKIIPRTLDDERKTILYSSFFITWLLVTLIFSFRKNNYLTTKYTLLIGSALGFAIPIINGFFSGNWMWKMYAENQTEILLVDILWLILSIISISILFRTKKPS